MDNINIKYLCVSKDKLQELGHCGLTFPSRREIYYSLIEANRFWEEEKNKPYCVIDKITTMNNKNSYERILKRNKID